MLFFSVCWRRATWTGWDLVQPGEPQGWELFGLSLTVGGGGGGDQDGRLEAALGRRVSHGKTT